MKEVLLLKKIATHFVLHKSMTAISYMMEQAFTLSSLKRDTMLSSGAFEAG
jgi:hypothetical protein